MVIEAITFMSKCSFCFLLNGLIGSLTAHSQQCSCLYLSIFMYLSLFVIQGKAVLVNSVMVLQKPLLHSICTSAPWFFCLCSWKMQLPAFCPSLSYHLFIKVHFSSHKCLEPISCLRASKQFLSIISASYFWWLLLSLGFPPSYS